MFKNKAPSSIQEIHDPLLNKKGVSLMLKRDDQLHPEISGNKWRKLKYNLWAAQKELHNTLLTFGGAYSNHIYATAAAAAEAGVKSIGVIRGEVHLPLNDTLQFATNKGMHLVYLNRERYRFKYAPAVMQELEKSYGRFYFIPEGGSNALAIRGCKEIIEEIAQPYDYICCPVGTGGTISGLIAGLRGKQQVLGFSALKGDFLQEEVTNLLSGAQERIYTNWHIMDQYHFGGYAKIKPTLINFIRDFMAQHHILLDPIYTGKMIYGLYDLINKDYFPKGSSIIAIHTGGLQGWKGMQEKYALSYNFDFLDRE